jgi:lipopolysaccharide/colanic/teichoic acid biosynthesis glycosyltransferase
MSKSKPVVKYSVSLPVLLTAWLVFLLIRSWGSVPDMIVIFSAAIVLSQLVVFVLGRKWGFRSAFIITLGAAIAGESASSLLLGTSMDWRWLTLAFLIAFAGGLLATAIDSGLWEDNSPPSSEIVNEVLLSHQLRLGKLKKIPVPKRCFDLLVAITGALFSLPVWAIISFLIWFEEPGPLLFIKNSVGYGGRNFHQFKFRSMVRDAERETGPILSTEDDVRLLKIGHVLRKAALDELPQLLNIIRGEMSFVGPRPQRTVLVREYLQVMPEYSERHAVAPGISGLAQVVGSYYISPRQKLRLDRLYVRHANLGFDLKLLVIAFLVVFYLRWKKDWNGRVPRKWIRFGSGRTF